MKIIVLKFFTPQSVEGPWLLLPPMPPNKGILSFLRGGRRGGTGYSDINFNISLQNKTI